MGIPEGKGPLGKYSVYGSVVLKQILNKIRWDRVNWLMCLCPNTSYKKMVASPGCIYYTFQFCWVQFLLSRT